MARSRRLGAVAEMRRIAQEMAARGVAARDIASRLGREFPDSTPVERREIAGGAIQAEGGARALSRLNLRSRTNLRSVLGCDDSRAEVRLSLDIWVWDTKRGKARRYAVDSIHVDPVGRWEDILSDAIAQAAANARSNKYEPREGEGDTEAQRFDYVIMGGECL